MYDDRLYTSRNAVIGRRAEAGEPMVVTGTVRDADGRPLPEAEVRVSIGAPFHGAPEACLLTGADGSYRVRTECRPRPGAVLRLTVSAPGHRSHTREALIGRGELGLHMGPGLGEDADMEDAFWILRADFHLA